MLLVCILILAVSKIMYLFPNPMIWEDIDVAGAFIWLEIEWLVFLGTLISNSLFIAIRTLFRHKIQLDSIPLKKQIPNIDTIIAIVEVSNAFNA
jgi:hypothetical protein